jgi:RES domain-containing protein
MRVFRVATRDRSASPLDGEGSFLYGGRWSSRGTRVAYTSTIAELARLEHAIHIAYSRIRISLVFVVAELPDRVVEEFPERSLPRDWDAVPATGATAAIGDAWAASKSSLGLAVPTSLIPRALTRERNVLINPAHPDFAKIKTKIVPFRHVPR